MMSSRTVVLVAVLIAAAMTPALSTHMDSQLLGDMGTLDLSADAIWGGSMWTYTYVLTYTTKISGDVHSFHVDNLGPQWFTGAANTGNFTSPNYDPSKISIDWWSGLMLEGESVTFSYQAYAEPDIIPVWALAVNAGTSSSGETLGMSAGWIPEPASLLTLTGMLACVAGLWKRARR